MKRTIILIVLIASAFFAQAQEKIVPSDFNVFANALKAKEKLSTGSLTVSDKQAIVRLEVVMENEMYKLSMKHGSNLIPRLKEYVTAYLPDCQSCVTNFNICEDNCPAGYPGHGPGMPCWNACQMAYLVCITVCSIPN